MELFLAIYIMTSMMICAIYLPAVYSENFYSMYKSPSLVEVMVLGLLGFLLGWLIFPIIIYKGFVKVKKVISVNYKDDE